MTGYAHISANFRNFLVGFILFSLLLTSCATPTTSLPPTESATLPPAPAATSLPTATTPPTSTPVPTEPPTPTETPLPTEAPTPTLEPFTPEDVIAYEMRGAFNFFWEQANTDPTSPGFGLIRDRYPGSAGIASMASVGFGLSAYPIGVEKGYITQDEGYARANGTLDTLLAMDRTEGFYYHFVDMQTGKRAWDSEVSSIDTAILMMGVLTAGQYFGGEVQTKAQQIYDAVNWPWFLDTSNNMFFMAYRPGEGYGGHWDFYAEQLMLYVLAAGSDTHPVDATPYYTFTRHEARFGEGNMFIHSWFGSIFTYQFSHAWIDFREYTDNKGVNWLNNSVDASLAQYNFAVAMEKKYDTLGPDAWGLTASDGPDGYNGLYGAPPSGYDNRAHTIDDTIAPAGAIGSIIFTPEQSLQAMMNYYTIPQLRSDYGFVDAYNLAENWYDKDVIGIDKGISLLMLANYENDTVHQIVMQNPVILNGLARLQITTGN